MPDQKLTFKGLTITSYNRKSRQFTCLSWFHSMTTLKKMHFFKLLELCECLQTTERTKRWITDVTFVLTSSPPKGRMSYF